MWGLQADNAGNLYISSNHRRVRKISNTGIISTFAGTGIIGGSTGDGGPATSANITSPFGISVDAIGNVYIACGDSGNIRKIDPSGIISTLAGNGLYGYSGDGGPATVASFSELYGILLDPSGNAYVCDIWNHRVRKITSGSANAGVITGPTSVAVGSIIALSNAISGGV